MNKPTSVIFDVGNVLYGWDPQAFLVRQIADDEERLRFIEDMDLWSWHESLDGGRAFADAEAEMSERFPAYAAYISAWGNSFGETISGPVPGMIELVEELDATGVPLFAITNFSADFWRPFAAEHHDVFGRFKATVVSGEEKLLKPDPAIYYLALDRFRLRPDQAIFFDDRLINIEAAEAVGMHAHLFTGVEGVRERLRAEGILA